MARANAPTPAQKWQAQEAADDETDDWDAEEDASLSYRVPRPKFKVQSAAFIRLQLVKLPAVWNTGASDAFMTNLCLRGPRRHLKPES